MIYLKWGQNKVNYIMKKILKILFITIAISFLLYSNVYAALVQCGNSVDNPCTYNDLIVLAKNIMNFALYDIALPLSVLLIVWGGIVILSSNGDESKIKKGRAIITSTMIGIGITFGAWLIVHTVIVVFF